MNPLFALSLLFFLPSLEAANQSEVNEFQQANRELIKHLFKDYDVTASPFNTMKSNTSWNSGNYLNVTLMRTRLIDLNERQRQFTANVGIVVEYWDPRLSWNPDDFHSIDHAYLRDESVWFPKFFPCDSSDYSYATFQKDEFTVNHLGQILVTYQFTVTYNCDIRNKDFPFDQQLCSLCFSLSGYREEEMGLRGLVPPQVDLYTHFVQGTGEWTTKMDDLHPIASMYYAQEKYAVNFVRFNQLDCLVIESLQVYYRLIFSRQPDFWIFLVILPTYFLGLLILVGLFFGNTGTYSVNSPIELGLTTMMSMTVIVGILNDSVPKSEDLSRLGYFVFFDILTICGAVVVVLFFHNIRIIIHKIAKEKTEQIPKTKNSSRYWPFLLRFTRRSSNARFLFFAVFCSLHTANLIVLLAKSRDSTGFEEMTQAFNVTST
ncbi:hypothetical protein PRIPAC_77116 [Pristionchus pacificus]|uniref:Transmembrane ion channel n=1 Tax=Pristionchus pacificus TaxID=54126 RepID=A0A2A6C276_PRIPA|nr:hypothetical protein PRIPAC_77116 [Pristionchus pacificus]|eukprot:PDM72208.1 transmembrane ion channel [Pristionchus pacificus]